MAQLLDIPAGRLQADTLQGLLEEFASRDGTDYGLREASLEDKVSQLRQGLDSGALKLLYDAESEHWDLVDRERAEQWLAGEGA
ncbi:YheU family protein [Parahaliea aestuarii]|uniref:YheU family protein n=1 Tax=Parahaliea aestuarii TaxID=1852021 RepID=A0A5C8ZRJ1_9GAMM|nr:YheU family protein [Parahaliea aestuarii]TXS90985.1 YheU family protein [Parahaliea aestuarii]